MFTLPKVEVVDTLLPDQLRDALIEAVSWLPMYFLNRATRFSEAHPLDIHWYYPIAFTDNPDNIDVSSQLADLDEQLQPIKKCWDLVAASYPYPVQLYECTASANTFGTEGSVHHDIPVVHARPRHHTVLVYCSKEWRIEWGGETLVFDEHDEISAAVMPRPGRVMKLQGDPKHVGRSVSRICPNDRRVLVFKFWTSSPERILA